MGRVAKEGSHRFPGLGNMPKAAPDKGSVPPIAKKARPDKDRAKFANKYDDLAVGDHLSIELPDLSCGNVIIKRIEKVRARPQPCPHGH